jgi:hypothetical protein
MPVTTTLRNSAVPPAVPSIGAAAMSMKPTESKTGVSKSVHKRLLEEIASAPPLAPKRSQPAKYAHASAAPYGHTFPRKAGDRVVSPRSTVPVTKACSMAVQSLYPANARMLTPIRTAATRNMDALVCRITLEATGTQQLRRSRLLLLWVRVGRPVVPSGDGQRQPGLSEGAALVRGMLERDERHGRNLTLLGRRAPPQHRADAPQMQDAPNGRAPCRPAAAAAPAGRENAATEAPTLGGPSLPCGTTLDVTGDQGKAPRSGGTPLGVRVD